MVYTYILKSKINSSFYVGSCREIEKRLDLHNCGLIKSTKRYRPWKIIYFERHKNFRNARKRELQIKSWKKRSTIEKLINNSKF